MVQPMCHAVGIRGYTPPNGPVVVTSSSNARPPGTMQSRGMWHGCGKRRGRGGEAKVKGPNKWLKEGVNSPIKNSTNH